MTLFHGMSFIVCTSENWRHDLWPYLLPEARCADYGGVLVSSGFNTATAIFSQEIVVGNILCKMAQALMAYISGLA